MQALIMAGGRGTRMSPASEKPMELLAGKPLLDHIVETLKTVSDVNRIVVACSPNAPETRIHAMGLGGVVEVCETSGSGYHKDMKMAIRTAKITGAVIVIASDVPLISTDIIKQAITEFHLSGKQSLCVLLPAASCLCEGPSPFIMEGLSVVATGVNIVDADMIHSAELSQKNLILDRPVELLNTNTKKDLQLANTLYCSKKI